jgi:hypothetical protein
VDERLDAPELPARVDAVQRERRAAAASHRARQLEVPGDLAAGLRVVLVDLREGLAEHELGDLARRLVLQAARLLVELVLAGVRLRRVPEGLAVVVMELRRVDRHDLEPVFALLEVLHDRVGEEVLALLPVVGVERPRLIVRGAGLGSDKRGEREHAQEAEEDGHRILPR